MFLHFLQRTYTLASPHAQYVAPPAAFVFHFTCNTLIDSVSQTYHKISHCSFAFSHPVCLPFLGPQNVQKDIYFHPQNNDVQQYHGKLFRSAVDKVE